MSRVCEDNNMLVTGHIGKICVFKLEDNSWSLSSTINTDWRAFDVTQYGNLIASAYFEDIHLWNAESGEKLAVYQGRNYLIDSLRFSFQEDCLISTDFDSLRIWDASQDGLSLISSDNNNRFETLAYAPSGIAASVFGNETGIHLFDGKNRSHLAIFIGCMCCAKSLSFSTDNSLQASYLG